MIRNELKNRGECEVSNNVQEVYSYVPFLQKIVRHPNAVCDKFRIIEVLQVVARIWTHTSWYIKYKYNQRSYNATHHPPVPVPSSTLHTAPSHHNLLSGATAPTAPLINGPLSSLPPAAGAPGSAPNNTSSLPPRVLHQVTQQ